MAKAGVIFRYIIQRFEYTLAKWLGFENLGVPALACNTGYTQPHSPEERESALDSLFSTTLWAVPKNRRSVEKRWTRKIAHDKRYKYTVPKKNITACLDCGQYHEIHTICGNCYNKVREETKQMMESFGDDLKYNVPRSEVVFLYENELHERPKYQGKYIVEMKRERPQWFAKNLLTKR